MSVVYLTVIIIFLIIMFRYVGLEYLNKLTIKKIKEKTKSQNKPSEKIYILTNAQKIYGYVSEPVVLMLKKGYIECVHSLPFLKDESITFKSIKTMGLDTFLPSGSPLDSGRVIKITLRQNNKTIFFVVKKDVEPWRAWIQSFGFRA